MAIVERADFVNKFEIHTMGSNDAKLQAYIDRYEVDYLVDLFGVELYNLFIDNIEDVIYAKLLDPILFQTNCGKIYNSKGIKDMLLGFIYFEYQRDSRVQQTINSAVKIKSNVSDRADILSMNLYGRFNESVETFKAIQEYLQENSTDYPAFMGVDRNYIYTSY
jgi:hypothetical protein